METGRQDGGSDKNHAPFSVGKTGNISRKFLTIILKIFDKNFERLQVESASSDIKIQEKRRVDLVYNLADCVKQYDKHESETLKAIVSGRTSGSNDIENVTTAVSAVSEAYPELKSSENYKQLMTELSMTENLIAEYRENYNKSVKAYRKYVKTFPQRSFLNMLGYDKKDFELLDFDAPESAPQNLFEE